MSNSTAQRERLIGPLGLALMAGAFVLAFFLLRPSTNTGTFSDDWLDGAENASDSPLSLDELDLAYVKARKAAGEIEDKDVVRVVLALVKNGRSEDAEAMLSQYPELDISAQSRSAIDLEFAAAQSDTELTAALRHLLDDKQRHTTPLLERAAVLSAQLPRSDLSFELYTALAHRPDAQSVDVYKQCGDLMASRGLRNKAVQCYQSALTDAADSVQSFDINLLMLAQLAHRSLEQQTLVDSMLGQTDLSVSQMELLAPAFLLAERPDAAYRVYARLALADEENAKGWLVQAAKWAEADSRLEDAAVFLDALAARTKDDDQRLDYLQDVIRLLMGAGRTQQAFNRMNDRIAQRMAANLSAEEQRQFDRELANGVSLARQLGKTDKALDWNGQRLLVDPANEQLLTLQAELALAEADLPLALLNAERAVVAAPDDVLLRERLARVSEWNGDPVAASDQWLWLSDPYNINDEPERRNALRELVRLSSGTFQSARAAQAQRELTLLEPPSDEEVAKLVAFYDLEGLPVQVSDALNDIMLVHGRSAFVVRTLAMHEYTHKRYAESLTAWRHYVRDFGDSNEALIYQVELLWRMDQREAAARMARRLRGNTLLSQANDYQLRLMSEIAWQYRMPWLTELVQPRIQTLQEYDMRTLYGRRSVQSLEKQGRDSAALEEAIRLWQGTGQTDFAISAMNLAVRSGNMQSIDGFLPEHEYSPTLRREPDYWAKLAAVRMHNGNVDASRAAYEQALKLDAEHLESIIGIVWLDIAGTNPKRLQNTLQRYASIAEHEPLLWQAMAVGYLQLGAPAISVGWFEKLLNQIDTDYAMLLAYADALEYTGRASDARRVRQYTLMELRPLLAENSEKQQAELLQQYANLSGRFSSANDNEVLVQRLLEEAQSGTLEDAQATVWREDLAIAWLMSTQRYEQARVVMTNLHSQRLEAPVWQRLALALRDKDQKAVEAIVQTKGPLSVGNHILALRQLGNDRKAYSMAQQALQPDSLNPSVSPVEFGAIAQQYASLRAVLPSYLAATFETGHIAGISTARRGLSVRHSFVGFPLGLGLKVSQRSVSTDRFDLDEDEDLSDVSLSLFFGNSLSGGSVTAGMLSEDEKAYASAMLFAKSSDEKRIYSAEVAFREQLTNSAELFLGARQNRFSASMDASLGRLPFMHLDASATQVNTRVDETRFADGISAQAELGLRGEIGNNVWSTSIQAGQTRYQRSDTLPDELRLRDGSSVSSVLQENAQRLSVGAMLSRGQVNADSPQSSTARYFVGARLGHSWPSRELGLSLSGGAGIRVLGGDELSFSINHDSRGVSRSRGKFTSMGLDYRYHF